MNQKIYIKLTSEGNEAYKEISIKSYKVMFSWCLFGGAMGYTAAQFMPFIRGLRQSPNLKRNRLTIFSLFLFGCSYHGYKKSLQVKKIGQRQISKDPRYILQEDDDLSFRHEEIHPPQQKEFTV